MVLAVIEKHGGDCVKVAVHMCVGACVCAPMCVCVFVCACVHVCVRACAWLCDIVLAHVFVCKEVYVIYVSLRSLVCMSVVSVHWCANVISLIHVYVSKHV